jgi:hypothetical protein
LVNFEIVFNFEKFERVEVVKFKPVDALCAPELQRRACRAPPPVVCVHHHR